MTAHVSRALRVLAPNDMRLIWRDGFLLLVVLITPFFSLVFRWLIPSLGELVAEWVELERYYGLILANFQIGGQPVLLGAVVGILFIEERDEGTLLALQATPLSLRSFLGYRLMAAMGLSIVFTLISVPLTGLVSISFLELLASAALASLAVPLVALTYAVYLQNKVQAVTGMKLAQAWGGAACAALLRAHPLAVDRKPARASLLPHALVLERCRRSSGVVADSARPSRTGRSSALAAAPVSAHRLCLSTGQERERPRVVCARGRGASQRARWIGG